MTSATDVITTVSLLRELAQIANRIFKRPGETCFELAGLTVFYEVVEGVCSQVVHVGVEEPPAVHAGNLLDKGKLASFNIKDGN